MSEYQVHIDREWYPWQSKVFLRKIDGPGDFHLDRMDRPPVYIKTDQSG